MRRARDPELHRTPGAQGRRPPDEVLALPTSTNGHVPGRSAGSAARTASRRPTNGRSSPVVPSRASAGSPTCRAPRTRAAVRGRVRHETGSPTRAPGGSGFGGSSPNDSTRAPSRPRTPLRRTRRQRKRTATALVPITPPTRSRIRLAISPLWRSTKGRAEIYLGQFSPATCEHEGSPRRACEDATRPNGRCREPERRPRPGLESSNCETRRTVEWKGAGRPGATLRADA